MNAAKKEFPLNYQGEMNKKPFEAKLNFRKSDQAEIYFFNSFDASLQKSNGEKLEQTIYLNRGKGITAKEAFNLLDGRAVHKELTSRDNVPYKAWVQLDFSVKDKNNNFELKYFHENYGYDLKAAVSKLAIAELKEPEKEKALMQSLQKGNLQSVTIEKNGNAQKMFIEANPQYKTVNLYDSSMKMVPKESIERYKSVNNLVVRSTKEDVSTDKKKELKADNKPEKEKRENKNVKSLLPKKRERSNKGLGV